MVVAQSLFSRQVEEEMLSWQWGSKLVAERQCGCSNWVKESPKLEEKNDVSNENLAIHYRVLDESKMLEVSFFWARSKWLLKNGSGCIASSNRAKPAMLMYRAPAAAQLGQQQGQSTGCNGGQSHQRLGNRHRHRKNGACGPNTHQTPAGAQGREQHQRLGTDARTRNHGRKKATPRCPQAFFPSTLHSCTPRGLTGTSWLWLV